MRYVYVFAWMLALVGCVGGDAGGEYDSGDGAVTGAALRARCEELMSTTLDRMIECRAIIQGEPLSEEWGHLIVTAAVDKCVSEPPEGMPEVDEQEFATGIEKIEAAPCSVICDASDEGCAA